MCLKRVSPFHHGHCHADNNEQIIICSKFLVFVDLERSPTYALEINPITPPVPEKPPLCGTVAVAPELCDRPTTKRLEMALLQRLLQTSFWHCFDRFVVCLSNIGIFTYIQCLSFYSTRKLSPACMDNICTDI